MRARQLRSEAIHCGETANIANIANSGVKQQVMAYERRAAVLLGAWETANTGTGNREHPAQAAPERCAAGCQAGQLHGILQDRHR
jgi:hypothetical protein